MRSTLRGTDSPHSAEAKLPCAAVKAWRLENAGILAEAEFEQQKVRILNG
jgi:hypothetical protein